MTAAPPTGNYGTTRERAASVSFAEIEGVARQVMATGGYPSVAAVRKELKRGSTTTIAEAMRRFWKNQAALDGGNPVALTRLPPEFADAAVDLWEQALRLSQQTAQSDDNGARARLEELRRDTDFRVRSVELREKQWDMAARVRERALSEARDQVGVLVGELAATRAELRSRDRQNADLETQIEQLRQQLATVIAKAAVRPRSRPRRPDPSAAAPQRRALAPTRRKPRPANARRPERPRPITSRRGTAPSAPKRKGAPRRRPR
jgi:Plasmid replication region DNA-binding N-term